MIKLIKKFLNYCIKPNVLNIFILFTTLGSLFIYLCIPTIISFLIIFVILEVVCRIQYIVFHKKKKERSYFLTEQDVPFTNHPYLPWVMRKNWSRPKNKKICSSKDYTLGGVSFNQYGLCYEVGAGATKYLLNNNNSDQYRHRILILGDSVSINYVNANKRINYPSILEKNLQNICGNNKIEVINGSCFAYTTQELLIKFLFDLQYFNPDQVIFYAGYADIRGYLTKDFVTDFSHFRNNIDSNYSKKILIFSFLLGLNSYLLELIIFKFFGVSGNLKLDLINMINKQKNINLEQSYKVGLETFSRNIETLIYVCKGKNVRLIISTYCHFLDETRRKSYAHQVFHSIINQQNVVIRKLCLLHGIQCVDNANLIRFDESNFLDDVHFSEKGMYAIVKNFVEIIIKNIKIKEKLNDY